MELIVRAVDVGSGNTKGPFTNKMTIYFGRNE